MLIPDDDGNVKTAESDHLLGSVCVEAKVRERLVKRAEDTDEIPDSFNLVLLRDFKHDHSRSTGTRDPEVNAEKPESALFRFSEDGRMYAVHYVAAPNQARLLDPGFKDALTETVEFTALLEVFGRVDESNHRYVTAVDVKAL